MTAVLLIDLSYVIYYKIYAIRAWYTHSEQEWNPDHLCTEAVFLEQLRIRCVIFLDEIVQRYAHLSPHVIICADGERSTAWRRSILPQYKTNRNTSASIRILFKHGYDAILSHCATKQLKWRVLVHAELEADDIVHGIVSGCVAESQITTMIIIANDHDYVPLLQHGAVQIENTKGKVMVSKIQPCHALLFKILVGDKSDNIPPVAARMGPKTAMRLVLDPELLRQKRTDAEFDAHFVINQRLIDNAKLPPPYAVWMQTQISDIKLYTV
jgi:5'-3' exonuclease